MKATDLMIGDWVSIKPLSAYIYTRRKIKIQDFANLHKMDFVPILLTPEILEKNGFWVMKKVDNGAEEYIAYAIDGLIFHYNRDNDYYFPNTPISWKYVHELQHALRLCGLNELADNFKVYEE